MSTKRSTNSQTEHSRQLRRETAQRATQEKLSSGIYKQFSVKGAAADIDLIQSAIDRAGGSRVQALKKICEEWLAAQN